MFGVCERSIATSTPTIRVLPGQTTTAEPLLDALDVEGVFEAPGLPLFGKILDRAGRPVEGAAVTTGPGVQRTTSGPDGRFGFCRVISGKMRLTVERDGYQKQTIRLNHDGSTVLPFEIRLRSR